MAPPNPDPALWLTACLFAVMGLGALVSPRRVVATFGATASTADLRNEIRAVYGGFGIALAALLVASATAESFAWAAPGARLTVAIALLGMTGGRLAGWCIERSGRWPWIFGAVELVLGGWLLAGASP